MFINNLLLFLTNNFIFFKEKKYYVNLNIRYFAAKCKEVGQTDLTGN